MSDFIQEFAAIVDKAAVDASPVEQLSFQREFSIDEAYAIQKASMERRYQRGEKMIGMKLGFTSKAKMEQMGLNDLIWGRLTNTMLMENGGNLHVSRCIHPRAEPEICFHVVKEINREIEEGELPDFIDKVAPAIEIIDSRFKNFKFSLADVIADNCSSSGLVIGEWQAADQSLEKIPITLTMDGEVKAAGNSDAILGNPWQSVLEASRLAVKYGQIIPAGSVIMAGAATQAIFLESAQEVKADAGTLGKVSFSIAD